MVSLAGSALDVVDHLKLRRSPLDELAARLAGSPSPLVVAELIEHIDGLRRAMTTDAWRAYAATLRTHPIASLLQQDPYTRRALEKPRGYAGDAVMMDYLYDGTAQAALTDVGAAVFCATVEARSGDAVRERRHRLAHRIAAAIHAAEDATIVSLACGHARELDVVGATLRQLAPWGGRWIGIDQDAMSLRGLRARCAVDAQLAAHVETVEASVKQILAGRCALPQAELLYSAGLFDYLDDRTAVALLAKMLEACRPGGSVIIANFASDSTDRGYMEAFMDWWLLYRSEDDLRRLAAATGCAISVSTYRDHSGRAIYLEMVRGAR